MYGNSNVGVVRDHNEDDFRICVDIDTDDWAFVGREVTELNSVACFLVADGMGGENAGEVASRLAVEGFAKFIAENKFDQVSDSVFEYIQGGFNYIHSIMIEALSNDASIRGMGTTLLVAFLTNDGLYLGYVGDCRAYLYSPDGWSDRLTQSDYKRISNHLRILTDDHSLVWSKVKTTNGSYTPEDARVDPQSNIITRFLGDTDKQFPPELIGPIYLEKGDKLLLCSDGLNGMLTDHVIEEIIQNNLTPEAMTDLFIENTNSAGGEDNTTLVFLNVEEGHHHAHVVNENVTQAAEVISTNNFNTEKIEAKPKFNYLWFLVWLIGFGVMTFAYLHFSKKLEGRNQLQGNELNQGEQILENNNAILAKSNEEFTKPVVKQSEKKPKKKSNNNKHVEKDLEEYRQVPLTVIPASPMSNTHHENSTQVSPSLHVADITRSEKVDHQIQESSIALKDSVVGENSVLEKKSIILNPINEQQDAEPAEGFELSGMIEMRKLKGCSSRKWPIPEDKKNRTSFKIVREQDLFKLISLNTPEASFTCTNCLENFESELLKYPGSEFIQVYQGEICKVGKTNNIEIYKFRFSTDP